MYNTDFLPQLEEFSRDLFGNMPTSPALPYEDVRAFAYLRRRGHGRGDRPRYAPPPGLSIVPCHEDINGEWVPNPVQGEER